MSSLILKTIRDEIATVTINRPEVGNAMTDAMWCLLRRVFEDCATDKSIRCVVLTGAGKAFCVGGDVKAFPADLSADETFDMEARIQILRDFTRSVELLHEMAKPTLAVIPGVAAGAGLCLALACDMRIAADSAKFTTAFARIGTAGDFGGAYFLTKLAGDGKARELYLTSELFSAQKALKWGIVNRVVPRLSLEHEAIELARKLASGPTIAFGYIKKNLKAAQTSTLKELLDIEAAHMIRTIMTEDYEAGIKAFAEKRTPLFAGR
jgi:2-(1,2-epoxy-1,2-dihydrophenyl)acetyl-CoA isomerase